jgi:hypothetical protein
MTHLKTPFEFRLLEMQEENRDDFFRFFLVKKYSLKFIDI